MSIICERDHEASNRNGITLKDQLFLHIYTIIYRTHVYVHYLILDCCESVRSNFFSIGKLFHNVPKCFECWQQINRTLFIFYPGYRQTKLYRPKYLKLNCFLLLNSSLSSICKSKAGLLNKSLVVNVISCRGRDLVLSRETCGCSVYLS